MNIFYFVGITLISLIISYILCILFHEICHAIVYRCFGYKILVFRVLFFTIVSGKVHFDFSSPASYVIVDGSSINNVGKEKLFIKHYRTNINITYTVHFIEIILAVIVCAILRSFISIIIMCSIIFICLDIFISSFLYGGDYYNFFHIKKTRSVLLAILCTGEILTSFSNRHIFEIVKDELINDSVYVYTKYLLLSYYLDFCIFHDIPFDHQIISNAENLMNKKNKYLMIKIYIWYAVNKKDNDSTFELNDIDLSLLVKDKNGSLILSAYHNIFRHNKSYQNYLSKITKILTLRDNV